MSDEMKKKDFHVDVKESPGMEHRTLLITGSTEAADRDGDIVTIEGWDLRSFNKNPVVLWAHDYSKPPVGIAKSVYVDPRTKTLCFRVYFPSVEELSSPGQPPSDHALFVDTVYNMYKLGLLNATSVGFIGKKMEPRTDEEASRKPVYARGVKFLAQELVELSCVPVPANPEALVQARSMKGFDPKGLDMLEATLPRAELKAQDHEEKGEEDMAEKLTEEEVTRLKSFIATLPPKDAEPEKKSGRKLSAASMERITKAIEHATNCMTELKTLASDGVEEQANEASDGVESNKSLDLSTATVEQANEYLRLGGDHKGA